MNTKMTRLADKVKKYKLRINSKSRRKIADQSQHKKFPSIQWSNGHFTLWIKSKFVALREFFLSFNSKVFFTIELLSNDCFAPLVPILYSKFLALDACFLRRAGEARTALFVIFRRICNTQEKSFSRVVFFKSKITNFYSKIIDSSWVRITELSSSRSGVRVSVVPKIFDFTDICQKFQWFPWHSE